MTTTWNKIFRWLYWHGLVKCKHDWVPARQFYREHNGQDNEYLDPTPMKHYEGYQAAPYVCRKCYDTKVEAEKIGEPDKKMFTWR